RRLGTVSLNFLTSPPAFGIISVVARNPFATPQNKDSSTPTTEGEITMAFELPPLPYDKNALEKSIDAQTMEIHHDKHHAAYTTNLNNAIKGTEWENKPIEEILRNIDRVPENIRTAVRNNGGGYANHNLFWKIMGPNGGGQPSGDLANAINQKFGSFDQFKEKLSTAAATQFGSGWGWLVVKS